MKLTFDNGVFVDLEGVAHAWITDGPQTIHLYYRDGHDCEFTGNMVDTIWAALVQGLRVQRS